MFQRTCITAFRRSAVHCKPAAKAVTKGPQMSKIHGAQGTEGDSVVDKVVVLGSLGAVTWWWCTVPGPQHQH